MTSTPDPAAPKPKRTKTHPITYVLLLAIAVAASLFYLRPGSTPPAEARLHHTHSTENAYHDLNHYHRFERIVIFARNDVALPIANALRDRLDTLDFTQHVAVSTTGFTDGPRPDCFITISASIAQDTVDTHQNPEFEHSIYVYVGNKPWHLSNVDSPPTLTHLLVNRYHYRHADPDHRDAPNINPHRITTDITARILYLHNAAPDWPQLPAAAFGNPAEPPVHIKAFDDYNPVRLSSGPTFLTHQQSTFSLHSRSQPNAAAEDLTKKLTQDGWTHTQKTRFHRFERGDERLTLSLQTTKDTYTNPYGQPGYAFTYMADYSRPFTRLQMQTAINELFIALPENSPLLLTLEPVMNGEQRKRTRIIHEQNPKEDDPYWHFQMAQRYLGTPADRHKARAAIDEAYRITIEQKNIYFYHYYIFGFGKTGSHNQLFYTDPMPPEQLEELGATPLVEGKITKTVPVGHFPCFFTGSGDNTRLILITHNSTDQVKAAFWSPKGSQFGYATFDRNDSTPITLEQPDSGRFVVTASPKDADQWAISIQFTPPDTNP